MAVSAPDTQWRRVLPIVELGCALVAAALWYTQGGAVWYAGGFPGAWPLGLLVIGWIAHLAHVRLAVKPGLRDGLFVLFLATALLGVWVAYDPGPAWAKFWLIVGAIGLYYALSHQPDGAPLALALAFFGLFGVAVSAYFFLTNDWANYPAKFPLLVSLGRRISETLPSLVAHRLHPNVLGGMLAMTLPLYVPLIRLTLDGARTVAHKILAAGWVIAAAISLLTLAISSSRGAWIALAGMGMIWVAWRLIGWWLARRGQSPDRVWVVRLRLFGLLGAIALLLASAVAVLFITGRLDGLVSAGGRLDLLRQASLLARDYLFTGAGLGMFEMQFSIYTLLIHVGYIVHSHNLLMNVLIEQGIVGLLSFAGLLLVVTVAAVARLRNADRRAAWIIEAAIAAMGVILIHGMVDDALYGIRGLLLLFAPLGMMAAGRGVRGQRSWVAVAVASIGVGVVVAALVWRPVAGALAANLGAVEQARVELSHYDQAHFNELTMDQVRATQNLDGAIGLFQQALQSDPANPTALQRLTEIDLARGQYAEALAAMQTAWDAGRRDTVTRLLYGDALVANGRAADAAQTVKDIPFAPNRISGQAWYRYWLGKDYRRAADAWATAVLLNPGDTNAVAAQAEAARLATDAK